MAFTPVSQVPKSFSHVREVRYSVANTPNSRVGRVVIPTETITKLGWLRNSRIEVLAGTEDDEGWFIMKPAAPEATYRAKLQITNNGVGRYNSSVLAPACITGPANSRSVEVKIDGNELHLNLFAQAA